MVPWRMIDWSGVGLYVLGSYFNTGSELQRRAWKAKPENKGRLYTKGLFSLSMHINYFGDALLFSGFALIASSMWAFILPVVMIAGFVFVHIPTLDRYLSQKYGEAFDEWARSTKKFVPFVY
jgi:steroid 5-alpha reductase family enzyme